MARTIIKPQDIFAEITDDFRKTFGADLVSIFVYGSSASGHYVPGKSDINFLIVLTDEGLNDMERCLTVVSKWRKRKVAAVFMTKAYIASSVDSYPVEFLNIKLNHIVVYGEDAFADLKFEPSYLRLQLERELKGKLFHLQRGFLDRDGKEKGIRELIKMSLGAFVPLFKALLFLRGYEIPHGRRDVVRALSLAFPINPDVFLQCVDIRDGAAKFSAREIKAIFNAYLKEIVKLSDFVDRIEV
jgi:hypothetical protein